MTQDMKKDMILHTIAKLVVPLKRTMSPLEADSHSACGGHFFNRSLLLLLMMLTLGVSGVKAQTPDYSGTYYIASRGYDGNPNNTNNYYLCPTEGWISYDTNDTWAEGDDNPFLTTYRCKTNAYHSGDPSTAVWIIEKHPTENYYYIKHKSDGKYLVSNGKISGTSNANRMRVHIETVAQDDLDDKALFAINPYSQTLDNVVCSYLVISPKSEAGWNKNQTVDSRKQDLKWYTVNNGNQNYLIGKTKDGGPSGHTETGGIIGLYTEYDVNAQFYFEDVITRPTITFNNTSNQIEITAAQTGTFIIKYTTDGSTPSSTNGETYLAPFSLAEGVTTIKAITIGTDWVSNVATFTNHKRLIQSQNNAWNTTDFHFYMTPGDEVSGITKVNTTSLFRSSMEWTFRSASVEKGIQYYYIINNANNKYLCYDATNAVYMDEFGSGGDNKFKFFIKESSRYSGTFHIIPYGNNILISKNNGNTSADAINTVGNNTNSNAISENAHWKFILPTDLDTDPPFTVTDASAHITKYYQIASVGSSGYYIVPPTGNNTNATTSNSADAAVVKSGTWYFEVAPAATASDWCTYYYIRNAETGKFLYFTKDANDAGACLEMKDAIESGNEERYKFTWARTATENTYYIIPKFVKDASQNQFSTLRRDGGTLKSNLNRGAGNYAWTFVEAALFCSDPIFEEEEGVIKIKCNTNASQIYINTESNADPDANSTLYAPTATTQNWKTTEKVRIKAIAVVSDGANSASSSVVTLLNKPDIALTKDDVPVTDETYTYDGLPKEPTISEVSIGEAPNKTTATAGTDYETVIDTDYSNNINAGTAKVTLRDKESSVYVWHAEKEFTIKKAPLTVTANNHSITYGDEPTGNGVEYSGFVNDETKSVIDDENLAYDYTYEQYGDVDEYAITPKGLSSDNYEFDYVNGTLTVIKKEVGLTWNPSDSSTPIATYDGQSHAPTVTANAADLVNGDDISVTVTPSANEGSSLTGTVAINAGSYTATASGLTGTKAGNYSLPDENSQTFTISPKPVTVSGITVSDKIYDGTTDATIDISGAAIDEIVSGDNLSVASVTGTFDTKDVGTDKTVTVAITTEGTSVGNYELSASGLTANITPKQLTITANDHTIGYGSEAVGNGVTYDSFVVGEDERLLEGTLTYVFNTSADGTGDAYTTSSPKGTYYIIPGGLHLPDGNNNYAISFAYGTLTVGPRKIGNGTDFAEGFTVNIDTSTSPYALTVYDGSTALIQGTTGTDYDYSIDTSESTDKYYVATITGANNYSDAVADRAIVKYAKVRFDSDGSPGAMWYGTFVAEADHAKPAGMTPYIITSVADNTATAVELDYIPNGVPVVLMTPEDAKGFLVQSGTGEISTTGNLLAVQATAGEKATATVYLLYKGEFVLNKAGTLEAGTVYLPVSSGSGARLKISRGDKTGIENIEYTIESQSDAWYTLDGRRLSSKPTKKGVYLQGGKKIVVK